MRDHPETGFYRRVMEADDPSGAIRELHDEELLEALVEAPASARELRAALASELSVRMHRAARFVDVAEEGLLGIDPEGRVTHLNPAAERLLGWRPEELRGEVAHEVLHFQDAEGHRVPRERCRILRALHVGERVRRVEEVLTCRDGSTFRAALTVAPLVRRGEVEGAMLVFADAAGRREDGSPKGDAHRDLERRVAERTRELAAINEDLEAFADMVSHDLRAPLRRLETLSGLVIDDYGERLDKDGREALDRMRWESRRMTHLVNDLLKFSQATRGELHREPVDVSALARQICDELQALDPDREVDVRIEGGLEVKADPRLLAVALGNLLRNAWKYTRRQPRPVIEVGASKQGGKRVFHVRDNGAGFDMTQAGRLFRPFQRLHRPSEFEGTGLGLVTVQRIIHRHGGRIWAEGRLGQGATLYFTL